MFSQFKQGENCEIPKLFFWGVPMGYQDVNNL